MWSCWCSVMLRDAEGMAKAIEELCQLRAAGNRAQVCDIRKHIDHLLDTLPLTELPGPMDAMRLLDKIALEGIHFPASLLMFRKASFTLEGVVEDVAGARVRLLLNSLMANHTLANWKDTVACLFSLLSVRDWVALDSSALTFTSRVSARTLLRPWHWLRALPTNAGAAQNRGVQTPFALCALSYQ